MVIPSTFRGGRVGQDIELKPGTRFGRYSILGRLAQGGMAEVYLANQSGPGGYRKNLVIKRVKPHLASDTDFVAMFVNEARLAAMLNHPNVVQIFDLGQEGEDWYLAMEYLDGRDMLQLGRACRQHKKAVPFDVTARILADACAALDHAHQLADANGNKLNLVHRDMSPENIMVTFSGQVKVLDFGIAKAADNSYRTQAGQIKGKLGYVAPEAIRGKELDGRADVFAVGATLYLFLVGRPAFPGNNPMEIFERTLKAPEPLRAINPRVPEALEAICLRCLHPDRNKRFQSAGEVRDAIEHYLQQKGRPITTGQLAQFMQILFPKDKDPLRAKVQRMLAFGDTLPDTSGAMHAAPGPTMPLTPPAPPQAAPRQTPPPSTARPQHAPVSVDIDPADEPGYDDNATIAAPPPTLGPPPSMSRPVTPPQGPSPARSEHTVIVDDAAPARAKPRFGLRSVDLTSDISDESGAQPPPPGLSEHTAQVDAGPLPTLESASGDVFTNTGPKSALDPAETQALPSGAAVPSGEAPTLAAPAAAIHAALADMANAAPPAPARRGPAATVSELPAVDVLLEDALTAEAAHAAEPPAPPLTAPAPPPPLTVQPPVQPAAQPPAPPPLTMPPTPAAQATAPFTAPEPGTLDAAAQATAVLTGPQRTTSTAGVMPAAQPATVPPAALPVQRGPSMAAKLGVFVIGALLGLAVLGGAVLYLDLLDTLTARLGL